MYNRYVRNDSGTYTRIPEEPLPPLSHDGHGGNGHHDHGDHFPPPPPPPPPPPLGSARRGDGISGMLRGFLDQFHLSDIDSGDLLLLGLLFFLFREEADEELLIALGLLLIL